MIAMNFRKNQQQQKNKSQENDVDVEFLKEFFSALLDSCSNDTPDLKESVIIEKTVAIAAGSIVGILVSSAWNKRLEKKRISDLEKRITELESRVR